MRAVFDRIAAETDGLDLLVNNVWGGYERYDGQTFDAPFWEQPTRHWAGMFEAGLRAHLEASRLAAPMMIARKRGLLVSTTAWDAGKYLGNLYYDVAKAAIVRMIEGMARELAPHSVTAIAVAPGWTFPRPSRPNMPVGALPRSPPIPRSCA